MIMTGTPCREGAAAVSVRRRAAAALLLLVPAPTVGVLAAMVLFPDSVIGSAVFAVSKLWLFGLPLLWQLRVERQPLSASPARRGGFRVGIGSGVFLSVCILGAWFLFGEALIDRGALVQELRRIGLAVPMRFALGAAYWIAVNSLLEEYAWRWFCVTRAARLLRPAAAAAVAALFFSVHHVVALQVYMGPTAALLCSAGVFLGGAFWSWMYLRYRSIWPGYVSHVVVDMCVFGLGAYLLFGPGAS